MDINNIDELNKNQTKRKIKQKIIEHQERAIKTSANNKSKVKHLTKNDPNYPYERKKYMNKLTRINVSMIFQARARMLEIKENYKKKYPDQTCRRCKLHPETQKHILTECNEIHRNEELRINYDEIYEQEDMIKLATTARKIRKIMDCLEKKQKETEVQSPPPNGRRESR